MSPDFAGTDVDAGSGAEWVAFEDSGQLLEVDGQGPQHRRWAAAEQSIKLVGQLIIPLPASLTERNHEIASRLERSVHALDDSSDKTVAGQLQRVIVGADATEQVHDSRAVTAVYGPPQGGALLVGVHFALRSLALPVPNRGPSDADVTRAGRCGGRLFFSELSGVVDRLAPDSAGGDEGA